MALTLIEEQKLQGAELDNYLAAHKPKWLAMLRRTHAFLVASLPPETPIRPDDVATQLHMLVEADKPLQAQFVKKKLKQKFWFKYFTNLVIDRLWTEI